MRATGTARLWAQLRGKREVQRKLVWSLILAFCTGVLQCYVSAIPMALFLQHFSSKNLPAVYLAVAFFSFLLGLTYSACESRFNLKWLTSGMVFIIALILSLLGFLLGLGAQTWVVALLVVWAVLSYELCSFVIWSVFSAIFNLQQAKNYFGLISGTQKIGGLLGGLLTPFLVLFFSLQEIIIGVGGGIFALIFIVLRLWNKVDPRLLSNEPEEGSQGAFIGKKRIWRNIYVWKIIALVLFAVFTTYIIDLMFVSVAAEKYTQPAELAAFLGLFFGIADGIDLLTSIFILHQLLRNYGVIATLAIYPVFGILATLALLFFLPWSSVLMIFILLSVLKLCEESVKSSFTDMGHLLLLQPFHPQLRAFVKSRIDLLVVGLATAFISITLLTITYFFGVSLVILGVFLLFCFLATLIILLTTKKAYISALAHALANRFFSNDLHLHYGKDDLEIYKRYLQSVYAHEVIFALNAIEKIDTSEFTNALNSLLQNPDIQVASFALDKVKRLNLTRALPTLLKLLQTENPNKFHVKLLEVAAGLNYARIIPYMDKCLYSPYAPLADKAYICLFKYGKQTFNAIDYAKIQAMAESSHASKRRRAAFIIGEIACIENETLLELLATDENNQVRRAAYIAAIKCNHTALFAHIITDRSPLRLPKSIFKKFCQNPQMLSLIEQHYFTYREETRRKCIYILKEINNKDARNFLRTVLFFEQNELLDRVLDITTSFPEPLSMLMKEKVEEKIKETTIILERFHTYLTLTPDLPATQLLRNALARKQQILEGRLFAWLAVYYGRTLIDKVNKGLASKKEDEISYALELLDNCLLPVHKKILGSLLHGIHLEEHFRCADNLSPEFTALLQENLTAPHTTLNYVDLLILLACCQVVILMELSECMPQIATLEKKNYPLVRETITWLQKRNVNRP